MPRPTAACHLLVAIVLLGEPVHPQDYSEPGLWWALPQKEDPADRTPTPLLPSYQDMADADVFYLLPTVSLPWGCRLLPLERSFLSELVIKQVIAQQAVVFNSAGRIFAPRYRQASLWCFFTRDSLKARQVLDSAYASVRRAFLYYLSHYNQGRPIILVGHSQGAYHIRRLLAEFFDTTELLNRLIVAYMPGFPVFEEDFERLRPCHSTHQVKCYMSWLTVRWGTPLPDSVPPPVCTSPLQLSHQYMGTMVKGKWRLPVEEARCVNGLLWVKRKGLANLKKIYHTKDISLFYMNLRADATYRAWYLYHRLQALFSAPQE